MQKLKDFLFWVILLIAMGALALGAGSLIGIVKAWLHGK
jgi:hypothetical protein